MREHLVTNVLATLLVLPLFAVRADAAPQDLDFFTNFEDVAPNTVPGEIIVIGVSPTTANLGGDAFGGRIGVGEFYHSGVRAWMVLPNGTGTVNFETDAATVEFWARAHRRATGATVITAYDALDFTVGSPVVISPGARWQLVSLTGGIARIDVVNLDGTEMNGIDDFGFTPERDLVAAQIDISPFRLINRVQLGSHQRVLVAILGSETINVTGIDAASLAFGPAGAPPFPGIKPALFGDRNGDGFSDLLARFDMDATGLSHGNVQACLTGKIDGAPFEGCDSVMVFAPPGRQP